MNQFKLSLLAVALFCSTTFAGPVDDRYSAALNLVQNGDRSKALKQFRELSNQYPSHMLAGNFHYWSGEALLGLNRVEEALTEFIMASTARNSSKVSHSRFMIATCYQSLDKPKLAKAEWERFLRDFPNDDLCERVKHRLRTMN